MVGVNHFQIILLVVHPIASKKGSRTLKRTEKVRYAPTSTIKPPSNLHFRPGCGRLSDQWMAGPLQRWACAAKHLQNQRLQKFFQHYCFQRLGDRGVWDHHWDRKWDPRWKPPKVSNTCPFKKHPPTPSEYSRRSMANVQVVLQPSSLE